MKLLARRIELLGWRAAEVLLGS